MCELACHHCSHILHMSIGDDVLTDCYVQCYDINITNGKEIALPGDKT